MKVVCVSIAIAALLCGCHSKLDEEKAVVSTATVKVGLVVQRDIRETVAVDGLFVLQEGGSAKLAPAAGGKLSKVLVREGDKVRAGQLLATIDTAVLSSQSQAASSAARSASAQADQSKASLRSAQADHQAVVHSSQLALSAAIAERDAAVQEAQADLERVRAFARPQEIEQAVQSVAQARANRDRAKADYERDRKLNAEGYVSGQQLDASRTVYEVAESALKQASSQLDLLKSGARKEDLHAAETKLRSAQSLGAKRIALAQAALSQAKKGELGVQAKHFEVSSAESLAAQKASEARAASAGTRNGEIRAPFNGLVAKRLLNPGDSTDSTLPVIDLVREGSQIDFNGTLPGNEVSKLAVGQLAFFPELPDIAAKLIAVGVADSQTGLVPVRLRCASKSAVARSGTFAKARIIVRTVVGLAIPKQAVLSREGKTIVYTVESGKAAMHEIEAGPEDQGFVAVRKGLTAGSTVILLGQHEISDGSPVQVEKAGGVGK